MSCECAFCAKMKGKSIPRPVWEEHHRPHMPFGIDFPREPFDHPSGTWGWLTCRCGAQFLTHDLFEAPNNERNDQTAGT